MFYKWPEIENHYNNKFINKWTERYPELKDNLYIVTEKMKGE